MAAMIVIWLVITTIVTANKILAQRQSCGGGFSVCAPIGANSQALPEVGPSLKNLYTDLIQVIDDSGFAIFSETGPAKRQGISVAFCCTETSDCLLLSSYEVPFCWDRFTTNFVFPDGSYGSIVAGNYSSSSGTKVDLIYGSYETQDGQTGNIYEGVLSDRPDTSTMMMPKPFTSSGVGSAIPATELGTMSILTEPTTRPAATLTAITLPSLTISVGPTACTRCLSHPTGPTATEGNLTSSGRPTIIFPPISGGWKGAVPRLNWSCLLIPYIVILLSRAM